MARSGRPRFRRRPARGPVEGDRVIEVHQLSGVLRELLAAPAFRQGMAAGRLGQAWEEVVGKDLARHTTPRSLSDGRLVVAVTSPAWAAQVRFLTEQIRLRAVAVLGEDVVQKVVITVQENR